MKLFTKLSQFSILLSFLIASSSSFAAPPLATPSSVQKQIAPKQRTSGNFALQATLSPVYVVTKALAPASTAKQYESKLEATGGNPSYRWYIQSGRLPQGLTLEAATGVIKGVPALPGSSGFVIGVSDAGFPIQQASMSLAIQVTGSLSIKASPLPTAETGLPYSSQALTAQGGTAPYSWSIHSGSLPAGLTLQPSTGLISGTPRSAGTSSFTVQVKDSSVAAETSTSALSLLTTAPLEITTPSLSASTTGQAYSATLQATGGVPAYRWSIASGSLPAGLSLSASTGTISGTPTSGGAFSFAVGVQDSESAPLTTSVALLLQVASGNGPKTWYVRPDGGTRYSTNITGGQCDGLGDAAYPGKGTNQHCAFNDVRFLWQDGSYNPVGASFPTYGWVGAGGDTYLIRGSLATGVSYRVGWSNQNASCVSGGLCYGQQGNPYASTPPPLSGTASQHTRILGENYGACHAASAKTQLHGGFGAGAVLTMDGTSYVDVACLDITDFSSCGRAAQTNSCNTAPGALDDYANVGITWSNASTQDTITDVHIHGLANAGMLGPTGNGIVMSYVDLIGNASSGWNADNGSGTTGTGSLLVQHYNISWNGCAEEYPMVDALPYQDCTDDGTGGYGDGFGTATVPSSPGWAAVFDQGVVSYNTQDGLDALHLIGTGSSMTVTRTLAYGNMGQQIKVGGAAGTAINNVIYTDCNALRQAIPGTPAGYNSRLSDFCRAADGGILLTTGANTLLRYDFNTIYSASATAVEIQCDTSKGACDSTSQVDFRNNIFIGFQNSTADGYPNPSGDFSSPIYNGTGVAFFANAGSQFSNNVTFHPKANWACPAQYEKNAICGDPNLVDESWHVYGYGNVQPVAGASLVTGAGTPIPGVTVDFTGQPRAAIPSMGAYN